MSVYDDFVWILTLTGVWSSIGAAQRWPDTHPGWGEEEDSEWGDQAASSGEKKLLFLLFPSLLTVQLDNKRQLFLIHLFYQRAQYQDKLARQRYEEQLRQQVRPSSAKKNTLKQHTESSKQSYFPLYSKSWMRKTFANRRNPFRNRRPWGKVRAVPAVSL